MTKEQAINDIVFWYDNQCKTEIPYAAISYAYMNLILSHPDPETGIVPCGCGGKLHVTIGTPGEGIPVVCWVSCNSCFTSSRCYGTKEEAIAAWNTAMGYKEAADGTV